MFERNKDRRPFLRYVAVLDGYAHPEHARRHNLVLPIDHPCWNVWAPPCRKKCRCTLQSLSTRDVERLVRDGEKLQFVPPAEQAIAYLHRQTGRIINVPDGVEPEWAFNPGLAANAQRVAIALSKKPGDWVRAAHMSTS